MSFAQSLAVGRSARLTALFHAAAVVGTAGGLLGAWQCAQGGWPLPASLLALLVPATCWVGQGWTVRRIARGVLRVEVDGLSNWNDAHARAALPFVPDRWCVIAGCAWISGTAGGRRLHLLSGADAHDDADWSRLMRWLLWLERGGGVRG